MADDEGNSKKNEQGVLEQLFIQTTWAIALVFVSIFIKEPLEQFLRNTPFAKFIVEIIHSRRERHLAAFNTTYVTAKEAKITATRLLHTASECGAIQGPQARLLVGLSVDLNDASERRKAFEDALKSSSELSDDEQRSFHEFSLAIDVIVSAVRNEFGQGSVAADGAITFEAHRLYLSKAFGTIESMRLKLDQTNS